MRPEYHVVDASTHASIAIFDHWGENVTATWNKAAEKRAVNLLCLWPCGCVRRALCREQTQQAWTQVLRHKTTGHILRDKHGNVRTKRHRKKVVRIHTGWRRISACDYHTLSPKEREAPENAQVRKTFLARCGQQTLSAAEIRMMEVTT